MYTLKICEDNKVITTVYETIMQRSNLVDKVQFLIPKRFKTITDMSSATITMEYIMPVSRELSFITLKLNDKNFHENYLQYLLPINSRLSSQAGEIEFFLTFTEIQALEDGTFEPHIEHTEKGTIRITAIPDFGNIDLDDFMRAFDQKLIAQDVILNKQDALLQEMHMNMVQDIKLDNLTQTLHLLSENGKLGNGVNVEELAKLIGEYIAGKDLDGVQDGVTHLDDIQNLSNITVTNLDEIIK